VYSNVTGIYFGGNTELVSHYASKGTVMHACYINAKNPFTKKTIEVWHKNG
jgi:hypothetical protein